MQRTRLALLLLAALPAALPAQQAAEPRWYKGNLHTHSLWSDGDDFPEVIADWYKRQDYHFLAFSDHNVLSEGERWMKVDDIVRRGGRTALLRYREALGRDWVETRETEGKLEVRLRGLAEFRSKFEEPGRFLLLQAEELSATFDSLPLHQNATNLLEVVKPRQGGSVRDTIAQNLRAILEQAEALDQPILAHLNHPNFYYAVTAEDLAEVLDERFFEVWNGHPSIHHEGDHHHASIEQLWDIANTLRIARLQAQPLYGLGTDDSHSYFVESPTLSNTGRGWIMVRAASLEPASLIEALQRGDFYASSGVTLRDIALRDGVLHVEVAPKAGERYTIRFLGTLADHDPTFAPVRDAEGKIVRATFRYSKDVGRVLAEHRGSKASYRLTGKELYVRAVVTSSAAPARPVYEGQRQQAWIQPVGFEHRVRMDRGPRFGSVACAGNYAGHLQGITTDRIGHVFWSFTDALVKTDAAGSVIAQAEVPAHHGDLSFWNGEIYVAVELGEFNRPKGAADPWVYVYSAEDLSLRRKHRVPEAVHGAGGIAAFGGRFFVVGGLPEGAEGNPVFEYDSAFRFVRRHEIQSGPTHLGIQTAEVAEGRFWFGCYGEPAELLITDLDFALQKRVPFPAAYGIAAVENGRFLVATDVRAEAGHRGSVRLAGPDPTAGLRVLEDGR